jgi:hypothetical protein
MSRWATRWAVYDLSAAAYACDSEAKHGADRCKLYDFDSYLHIQLAPVTLQYSSRCRGRRGHRLLRPCPRLSLARIFPSTSTELWPLLGFGSRFPGCPWVLLGTRRHSLVVSSLPSPPPHTMGRMSAGPNTNGLLICPPPGLDQCWPASPAGSTSDAAQVAQNKNPRERGGQLSRGSLSISYIKYNWPFLRWRRWCTFCSQ